MSKWHPNQMPEQLPREYLNKKQWFHFKVFCHMSMLLVLCPRETDSRYLYLFYNFNIIGYILNWGLLVKVDAVSFCVSTLHSILLSLVDNSQGCMYCFKKQFTVRATYENTVLRLPRNLLRWFMGPWEMNHFSYGHHERSVLFPR